LLRCTFVAKAQQFPHIFQIFEKFLKIFPKIGNLCQNWHTYCMETLRDRLKPLIPDIVNRTLTGRAAARRLGVSESHLCRVLKQLHVERAPIPDNPDTALRAARVELRQQLANDPSLTIEQAAARANCSTRTIYRYKGKA